MGAVGRADDAPAADTAVSLLALSIAFALPVAFGWGLTRVFGLAPAGPPLVVVAGRLALSGLVGIGLSSISTFAWLLAGGQLGRAFALADAAAFGVASAWLALRGRRATAPDRDPGPLGTQDPGDRWATTGLLLIAAAALVTTGALGAAAPAGEMDAWMMWNMRARFLLRAGEAWRIGFAPELGWTSTEYPLLLPLSIARLWAYAGETQLAPAALASFFTTAAPVSLAAAVGARSDAWRGSLAGLLLVASPGFLSLGASQYADVPLAAYLVASFVAAALAGSRVAPLVAQGLFLGMAGWTKNEGVLAAGIVVTVSAAADVASLGPRAATKRLLSMAAGAAMPAAAWLAFHAFVMPRITGVLFMGHTAETALQRLMDLDRWGTVLRSMAERLPGFQVGFPAVVLAVAALFAWRARSLPRSRALAVALLLLVAHAFVFMMTTWDLAWHLRLAADRVVLQAWPILLLGLFGARVDPRPDPA
jgi:hypothetical protein